MNEETKPLWTLEQGIELARRLEKIALEHNAHVALGGGTLHRGHSNKDLDIFVYPRKTTLKFNWSNILAAFGASQAAQRPHEYQGDRKIVFQTEIDGKRVDIFFLK